jgi:predicted Rossmann-fold nucleotide-binding protein
MPGGVSIGLNIVLPHEQAPNAHVTPESVLQLPLFRDPQDAFPDARQGDLHFPGGFGTLDEMFEALTLIQTGRMKRVPILLFGRSVLARIINWEALADAGTISDEDLELFRFVETADAKRVHIHAHRLEPLARPPSSGRSMMKAQPTISPPSRSISLIPASAVPPVASRSSTSSTFSPG